MADIDPTGYVDPWCNSHSVLDNCTRDELDRALARLAAVEAERNGLRHRLDIERGAHRSARARLAAVEALCSDPTLRVLLGRMWNDRFSAALRGEGDQPAEHHDTEDAHGNPICVCPDLRGEGDRPTPPLLDECGQPFPCAHRAHNPDLNHPMAGGAE